ncbi:hypothetical protein M422DRAFT_267205 [Sphaerobolus stellatus SS14]|uniref:Uncharacterized protein n=1 Tax=Sphaerobolus stellatus (strain SS14) TaxID=990650 RepID=A0A0C9U9F1_SPHS4|nr:hypothetical protein M422DRAFT_267205 [Sphaerobolus stellatus SS14]
MIKRGLDLIDGFRIACKNLNASAGTNPTCRAVFRKPSTYPTAIITPFRTVAYRVLTPSQIHERPAHLWIGVRRATVTLAVHRLECSMRIPILFARENPTAGSELLYHQRAGCRTKDRPNTQPNAPDRGCFDVLESSMASSGSCPVKTAARRRFQLILYRIICEGLTVFAGGIGSYCQTAMLTNARRSSRSWGENQGRVCLARIERIKIESIRRTCEDQRRRISPSTQRSLMCPVATSEMDPNWGLARPIKSVDTTYLSRTTEHLENKAVTDVDAGEKALGRKRRAGMADWEVVLCQRRIAICWLE